jgi:hypothetical protein
LIIHQSVHLMAGAIGIRMRKGAFEVLGGSLQFAEFFPQAIGNIGVVSRPFQPSSSPLAKLGGIEAMKESPEGGAQVFVQGFMGATALLNAHPPCRQPRITPTGGNKRCQSA